MCRESVKPSSPGRSRKSARRRLYLYVAGLCSGIALVWRSQACFVVSIASYSSVFISFAHKLFLPGTELVVRYGADAQQQQQPQQQRSPPSQQPRDEKAVLFAGFNYHRTS